MPAVSLSRPGNPVEIPTSLSGRSRISAYFSSRDSHCSTKSTSRDVAVSPATSCRPEASTDMAPLVSPSLSMGRASVISSDTLALRCPSMTSSTKRLRDSPLASPSETDGYSVLKALAVGISLCVCQNSRTQLQMPALVPEKCLDCIPMSMALTSEPSLRTLLMSSCSALATTAPIPCGVRLPVP